MDMESLMHKGLEDAVVIRGMSVERLEQALEQGCFSQGQGAWGLGVYCYPIYERLGSQPPSADYTYEQQVRRNWREHAGRAAFVDFCKSHLPSSHQSDAQQVIYALEDIYHDILQEEMEYTSPLITQALEYKGVVVGLAPEVLDAHHFDKWDPCDSVLRGDVSVDYINAIAVATDHEAAALAQRQTVPY